MNKVTSSNLKLRPFDYGAMRAKGGGGFYFPYDDAMDGGHNNREFKRGWDSHLRKTAGVAPGREQPLP